MEFGVQNDLDLGLSLSTSAVASWCLVSQWQRDSPGARADHRHDQTAEGPWENTKTKGPPTSKNEIYVCICIQIDHEAS